MRDWDWVDWSFRLLVVTLIAFLGVAIYQECSQQTAFMRECLTEKKQYECTAMWRAGEMRTVPVFIYGGR